MHPILFRIPMPGGGHFDVASYGVMMALGTIVCVLLAMRLGKREGVSPNTVIDLGFWAVISGVIGAKIWFIVQFWPTVDEKMDLIRNFRSGLVWYGGMIAGAAAMVVYLRAKRLPILKTLDVIAAPGILGLAFGRVGCFLNGCCWGRETTSWYGVSFKRVVEDGYIIGSPPYLDQYSRGLITTDAPASLPVIPTQLMEATLVACVFAALLLLKRTRRFYGEQVALVFVLYAAVRFTVELARGDSPQVWLGLTVPQIFSASAFIAAVAALLYLRLARPKSLAVPGTAS